MDIRLWLAGVRVGLCAGCKTDRSSAIVLPLSHAPVLALAPALVQPLELQRASREAGLRCACRLVCCFCLPPPLLVIGLPSPVHDAVLGHRHVFALLHHFGLMSRIALHRC